MKKLLIVCFLGALPTFADTVTYNVTESFGGPDVGGPGLSNGGATIAFSGQPLTSVSAPTNISLGYFTITGGGGIFTGDSFQMTINQTAPSSGTGISSSTIDGTVQSTSTGIDVHFAPTTFNIGDATYVLQSDYFLVPSSTNTGVTSIQAKVSTTPEPATNALVGVGLIGLAAIGRRRFKTEKGTTT